MGVKPMHNYQSTTTRIARNTGMLYVRMLFSMLVSLYTSRVILLALGVEDFGIVNVVGGLVTMFSLVSSSLSSSVSRFMTFELGRGEQKRLAQVFSTSLLIHIALAVVVLALMETVGRWFLNTCMVVPPERIAAANWVFQASIVSFLAGLLSVPFNAAIVAHEKMDAFAYIGIMDIVLRLCLVLAVAYAPLVSDRMIAYSVGVAVVSVAVQGIYVCYCRRRFPECRSAFVIDCLCWRRMCAFAGWNFIGCASALLRDQGVNILLNLFCGPVVNAARGIAMSVNTAIARFADNFMTALRPQITKSYAAGQREYMMSLVERGARFSYYIMLLVAMPILMETEPVLSLWLKSFPAHTVTFVRLVLVLSLVDILSGTLITLQTATGRIRNYQLAVGGVFLLNFPLSFLCLEWRLRPESVFVVAIVLAVLCLWLRLWLLRRMVGLSVRNFIRRVCARVVLVSVSALSVPMLVRINLDEGWLRFAAVCVACLLFGVLSVLLIGCTRGERLFIAAKVKAVVIRTRR